MLRILSSPPLSRAVRRLGAVVVAAAVVATSVSVDTADARKRKTKNHKYAALVMDARTGKVLFSRNGNAHRYPASLTKMMTLYLMFEEMKRGTMSNGTRIKMTRNAAAEVPSKLGIRAGRTITAQQAVRALVTKSANDVATAVGEHIAGSEAAFARRMTLKARQLGMTRTTFRNAHGLPNRAQKTTARDMARLGLALRQHFPKKYSYFQTRSFKYGRRNYRNHNRLLGRVRGVDGIKTGYTRASGYNLVTSAGYGKRRIVAVVMGGRSGKARNAHMTNLVNRYLRKASRRGSGRIIAAWRPSWSGGTTVATASVTKPSEVAVPSLAQRAVEVAAVATPNENPVAAEAEAKQILAAKAPVTPKPVGAWEIQIGATDSRQQALDLLDKAKARARATLAQHETQTQPVQVRGSTLYRARFTGFGSKAEARQACRALKRKKFACLALKG